MKNSKKSKNGWIEKQEMKYFKILISKDWE